MAMFRRRPPASPPRPDALRAPQPVAPPPPPPEFLRETEVRTSLGPDAVITGRLSFTTPTRIAGKLKGELRCTQLLIIAPTAQVEGSVKAEDLRVEGLVLGDIIDTRKVEIARGGRVLGNIQAQALVIHEGGLFEGRCRMGLEETAARNQARR